MVKSYSKFGWRSATTLIWASVVISFWFWAQASSSARVFNTADAGPAQKTPDMTSAAVLSRLLGASSLPQTSSGPNPADRFVLSGVIASRVGQGAALIAVDGKPARPFTVGSTLAPGYMLVSVGPREAMLAEELNVPARLTLSLPLQGSQQSPSALQTAASVPGVVPPLVSPTSSTSGLSPLVTPNLPEQTSTVPARADARRQPQQPMRREDQRTP